MVNEELNLHFALGLFTDFLVRKGDEKVLSLISQDPFDKREVRGYVHEEKGRYHAVRFEERKGRFRMASVVSLAGYDRRGAAQNYVANKDLAESGKAFLDRLLMQVDVGWLEGRIGEYKRYLVDLAEGKSEAEVSQLRAEAEALEEFVKELKEAEAYGLKRR